MEIPKFNERHLYTPSEIIETYPQLRAHNWTANFIGQLLSKNLLNGKLTSGKRSNLIDIRSFTKLIEMQNIIVNDKKIHL